MIEVRHHAYGRREPETSGLVLWLGHCVLVRFWAAWNTAIKDHSEVGY